MAKKKQVEKKKIQKTIIPEIETKKYDPLKPKGLLDFKGWYKKWKDNRDSTGTYLIDMELRNGMHDIFVTFSKKDSFKYKNGLYVIDNDLKYYVDSAKLWCLSYHQNCTLPIKRKIPFNDISKVVENLNGLEIESAINPYTLEKFVESQVIEKVMQGHEMSEWMKKLMYVSVIGALASVIMLVTYMIKTGMFSQLKNVV